MGKKGTIILVFKRCDKIKQIKIIIIIIPNYKIKHAPLLFRTQIIKYHQISL